MLWVYQRDSFTLCLFYMVSIDNCSSRTLEHGCACGYNLCSTLFATYFIKNKKKSRGLDVKHTLLAFGWVRESYFVEQV